MKIFTPAAEQKGFMWKSYGFTKLHLWGLFLTGGFCASVGMACLMICLLWVGVLKSDLFYRLLYISASAFLAAMTTTLFSIFSLVFYLGQDYLSKVPERQDKPTSMSG